MKYQYILQYLKEDDYEDDTKISSIRSKIRELDKMINELQKEHKSLTGREFKW